MGATFGRYELVEQIALRDATELFLVKVSGEHGFERNVVLKRLRNPALATSFIADARLAARLSHPKIVQTLELGEVTGTQFVVVEHVDGTDLLALLHELARQQRTLAPEIAAWIAHELLDALDYVHTLEGADRSPLGLIHGRLSPSKVLIGKAGETKLCDFGVPGPRKLARSGVHDFGHLAPEQILELPTDARTDVFGVGVLLAEMLTGRKLFAATNELDVLLMIRDLKLERFERRSQGLPAPLVELVRAALVRVDDRTINAAAFRDALSEWLFEHRHRTTFRHLAQLVSELGGALGAHRGAGGASDLHSAFDADDPLDSPIGASTTDAPAAVDVPGIVDVPAPPPPTADRTAGGAIATPRRTTIEIPPRRPPAPPRTITIPSPVPPPPGATTTPPRPATTPPPPAATPATPPATAEPASAKPASAQPTAPPTTSRPPAATREAATGATRPRISMRGVLHPQLAKPTAAKDERAVAAAPRAGFASIGAAIEALLPAPTPVVAPRPRKRGLSPVELATATLPVPPTIDEPARPADEAGDLAEVPAIRIVFQRMLAQTKGLLSMSRGDVRRNLYLRDGLLTGVWSSVADELFGHYLVSRRVVSDGELTMALAMIGQHGGKLGDTLIELGLITTVDLFRHLTWHARARVIDICASSSGRYAWYAGHEDPLDPFPVEVEGLPLLAVGAQNLAEEVVEGWIARHRDSHPISSPAPAVAPDRFHLTGLVELHETLDGTSTVGELLARETSHLQQLRVARSLYLLVACELAQLDGAA